MTWYTNFKSGSTINMVWIDWSWYWLDVTKLNVVVIISPLPIWYIFLFRLLFLISLKYYEWKTCRLKILMNCCSLQYTFYVEEGWIWTLWSCFRSVSTYQQVHFLRKRSLSELQPWQFMSRLKFSFYYYFLRLTLNILVLLWGIITR